MTERLLDGVWGFVGAEVQPLEPKENDRTLSSAVMEVFDQLG